MQAGPRVEVLWWEGCPSTPRALADLRAALAELGLDPEAIELREVRDDRQAAEERFVGSPTLRVDGRDVVAPGAEEPFGLACRLYHRRDGRVSPTPDPADLRAALAVAVTTRSAAWPAGCSVKWRAA